MIAASEAPCVLVVEDDRFSGWFAELLIRRVGYRVFSVDRAEAARTALIDKQEGYFSCLLADYLLPGESGLDLLAWAKRRHPTLAGVLMTADSRKSLVEEALQAGAIDFINKPLEFDQLRGVIDKAVATTAQRRQTAQMERDVEEVAEVQRRMVLGDAEGAGSHRCAFILNIRLGATPSLSTRFHGTGRSR